MNLKLAAFVSDTLCILHFATMVRTRFNHNLESLRRNNVRQTQSSPDYGAEICRHHGVRHPTGWCQALPRPITIKAEQGK